jgi:hypothetical protein
MSVSRLEFRVAALERELTEIKKQLARTQFAAPIRRNWIDQIWGMNRDDSAFEEAMRLGRKWRDEENRKLLRKNRGLPSTSPNRWIEKIAGTFSSPQATAAFDEAMRLGRQWRNAQRPKQRKRKASRR